MKRKVAFIPVVLLFLTCCKQEEKTAPSGVKYPVYSGTAAGLRNGQVWHASIAVEEKNKKIALSIVRFNKDSVVKEALLMNNIPMYRFYDTLQVIQRDTIGGTGTMLNTGAYCMYKLLDDWDLTTTPLDMMLSKEHWLEVTDYYSESKTIKGKFSVSYFNPYLNMDKDSIITFENIEFSAKILK